MTEVQLFGRQQVSRDEFDAINAEYRDVFEVTRDQYTYFSSGAARGVRVSRLCGAIQGGFRAHRRMTPSSPAVTASILAAPRRSSE